MSYIANKENALEIPKGTIVGHTSENKFGRSTNVDNGADTDIWDRANAVDAQAIWIPPTTARLHDIVSGSALDDGAPVNTGARTIRVFGLTGWGTAEVNEDITMNGVGAVTTANAYVIIYRMEVLTAGAAGPNVGLITATAQADGTVTAQINADEGQTQMAIYGIPSIQTAFVTNFYGSVLRANLSTNERHVDIKMLFNPEPDANANTWLIKHSAGCGTRASSPFRHEYHPYKTFAGPGILKMQAIGSSNDLDVSSGFDLIIVDN